MSTALQGREASGGIALGPAFVVHRRHRGAPPRPGAVAPEQEHARLDAALAQTERDLRALAHRLAGEIGAAEAAIFEAHAEFAADPEVARLAHAAVNGGATAEDAVQRAYAGFRDLLVASGDDYLAARATDVEDVANAVLDILGGAGPSPVPGQRSVIVAYELTPSETARLPPDVIAGIACESGSPTSHAAILARCLGIPCVVAVTGLLDAAAPGTEVALDGGRGLVVVEPGPEERAGFEARSREREARLVRLGALRYELGQTADGRRVELAANVGGPADLPRAEEAGAEGCGLVRTEFLFLERRTAPDVAIQERFYREVLGSFPGRRVVFRTMDIGADKPLAFARRPPEENPALGVRGLRLSLLMTDLLRDQLRALLRASAAGRLAIMFPMVTLPEELDRARGLLEEVAKQDGLDASGVEVGAMIEVPAAALAARRMARRADFLSIGTNDLLQYLFAADRLQGEVAGLPDLMDPDVLRLVGTVVEAAHAEGAWVGVCGEAASDPVAAAALVGLGMDELSMAPVAIPEVKAMLRDVSWAALAGAARAALDAPDAASARRMVQEALPQAR